MITITKEKPTVQALRNFEDEVFGAAGTSDLALNTQELRLFVALPQVIIVSAFDDEKLIGYSAGAPFGMFNGVGRENSITPKNSVYFLSLGVRDKYRNQGIAQKLIDERLRIAKERGFSYGCGHFRSGASVHLARKNLQVTNEFSISNYGDSGETYYYIVGKI